MHITKVAIASALTGRRGSLKGGEWIYTVCNGRPHAWRLESI